MNPGNGRIPQAGGALGLHAESTVRAGIDAAVRAAKERGTVHDHGLKRRWALQRQAGRIMNDKVPRTNRDGQEVVHWVYRVAMCHRGMEGNAVSVHRSPDGQRAEFSSGVQTCASPWHCPVCAPKIAARQVEQMNLGIHRWLERGGSVYFLTLTNQHERDGAGQGECKPALNRLTAALGSVKGKRAWRDVMKLCGSPGSIRALETTYGELNGWHHHTHEILFGARDALVMDRRGGVVRHLSPLFRLARIWARELIQRGLAGLKPGDTGAARFKKLRDLLTYCLDVRPGAYAAEYVAKFGKEPESERGRWGMASELAKSHLKAAASDGSYWRRCVHASPWELLNDALDGDLSSEDLWREFALAFHGRAKLYWSPGLKALLDIPDISEIEFARAPDARCTVPVCDIGPIQWRLVIAHDARFEVLRAAALDGRAGVEAFLAKLEGLPARYSGDFTVRDRAAYPPGYTTFKTPDGATHRYWEQR